MKAWPTSGNTASWFDISLLATAACWAFSQSFGDGLTRCGPCAGRRFAERRTACASDAPPAQKKGQ